MPQYARPQLRTARSGARRAAGAAAPCPILDATDVCRCRPHAARRIGVAQLFFAGGAAVSLGGVAVATACCRPRRVRGMRAVGARPRLPAAISAIVRRALRGGTRLPLAGTCWRCRAGRDAADAGLVSVALGDGLHSAGLGFWPQLIVARFGASASIAHRRSACGGAAVMAGRARLERSMRGLPGRAPRRPRPAAAGADVSAGCWLAAAHRRRPDLARPRPLAGAARRARAALPRAAAHAADWYWEHDEQFRFVHFRGRRRAPRLRPAEPSAASRRGRSRRLRPRRRARLDAHRADLESHQPFSGLLLRRTRRPRPAPHHQPAAASRASTRRAFRGYLGRRPRHDRRGARAARDARPARLRYRELFDALAVAAVPAPARPRLRCQRIRGPAVRLRQRRSDMNGFNMINALSATSASRDRDARRASPQLEGMAAGEALPVADFVLRAIDGQCAQRAGHGGARGPTAARPTLSIFFDVTARHAAEAALRRSEAMLSHLFATSPGLHHADRNGERPLRDGQPGFSPPHRLRSGRGRRPHRRRDSASGTTRPTADRLVEALEQRRQRDRPAGGVRHQLGRAVSMLLSAGPLRDGRQSYLVSTRATSPRPSAHGCEHAAILQRASIGIAFTRDACFASANPCFERMFGWDAGALAGQPWRSSGPSATDDARGLARSPAARPPRAVRVRAPDAPRATAAVLVPAARPGASTATTRCAAARIWIAEDVTERRRARPRRWRRRATPPRPRAAPRAPFLANTSHEIRTPLNGLLGLARLAMRDGLRRALRQQYLEQILDSAQSLAGDASPTCSTCRRSRPASSASRPTPFDLREPLESVHRTYLAAGAGQGPDC